MRIKNYLLLVLVFILSTISTSAQLAEPFAVRNNQTLRGDMHLIGNNILNFPAGPGNSNAYDLTGGAATANDAINMSYIDIDSDASTFSSSSATFTVPAASASCYRIRYAALYWSATYIGNNRVPISNVKLKLPTSATYVDIAADDLVYDEFAGNLLGSSCKPYAAYKDITAMVTAQANPQGVYTVANVTATTGDGSCPGGYAAGWSIYIIYEDPNLPGRYFTSFDGFAGINGTNTQDIDIVGFTTIPVGPVRAKTAFSALEGDNKITGDRLRIRGVLTPTFSSIITPARVTISATVTNGSDNFFNSTITDPVGIMNGRTPNSINTLGYDAGIANINNTLNSVIQNGETAAKLRMQTDGDQYYMFFTAFAIDIIEPNVVLTKTVQNLAGVDIGGADVNLCQDLVYTIGFQNIGNDDATNFTIRDVLPINVTFNPADLALPGALPPGVTFVYTAATRTIVFTIPSNLVNVNDPRYEIKLRVKVVCTCDQLDDACSNVVTNQAFASYQGVINTAQITDDPSLSNFSSCNLSPPSPTNFLVGLDDCNFTTDVVLCGNNPITLTAANGYTSYVWSGPGTITPVAGTNNQSVIVNQIGTYTVNDIISLTPCKSIVQTFNVTDFGAGALTNPVIPYADSVVICPNDGVQLPLIFLCGAGDHTLIQTNISGATSITWEQLNLGGACVAVVNPNCANTSAACNANWTNVGTGPNYDATTAGEYRVTVDFNGCARIFYFNVFQNTLNPIATPRDVVCTTQGQITITGVPAGYEYQLNCTGAWQAGNVFTGLSAGIYSVCIRQTGIVGGCVFTVSNIPIVNRVFTVSAILTQPICSTDKGTINLAANGVLPQYTFTINQMPGSVLVGTVGPTNSSSTVFNNLNPGNYTYTVTTQDGCTVTTPFTINQPPPLTATVALTKPLTCTDGEITVSPVGGTPPFNYIVTGAVSVTQGSPIIAAPVAGTYNIQVVDNNNCFVNVSITVAVSPPPVFNIIKTDVVCSTPANTGTITINVTNANGSALLYSIDNGVTFFASNVFNNLVAGTYNVVVQYTLGTSVCTTVAQAITIIGVTPIVGIATLTTDYTCTHPGIITVSGVGGGTPGYTYSIDGITYQAGTTFTITAAGTYTIIIKDSRGCTFATNTIVVPALDGPRDLLIRITDKITCPTMTGNLNAQLILGGSPPIRFRIISPFVTPYNSSGNFLGLTAGTYCFEVIDKNDCTYTECFTFEAAPPAVIVPQVTNNVRCFGTNTGNGQFTITGIPNSTDYSYTLTPPGTTVNGTTPAAGSTTIVVPLNNVAAGTYNISVYNDANECTYTSSLTIAGPASALLAPITPSPITCLANGQVVVNASGGWGGYTYTFAPPTAGVTQAGNVFSNIPAGTYTVTTTDSGGCAVSNTFTLVGATPPTATISAASNFCYSSPAGATIVVTPSGGVAPYTYTINGATNPSNVFSNLTPGTYTIIVTDAFGCTVTLPVQTIAPQLTLTTVFTKDLDCTASPNAVITGTIGGGYPGYTYQVRILPAVVFTNLGAVPAVPGNVFIYSTATAGSYQFQVTDLRGCIAQSDIITINPLVPVTATHTQVNNLCFGDTAGSVTITPSGGVPAYVISFNGSPFTSTFTYSGLAAGTYPYIVRDTKSCTFNGSVTITAPLQIAYTAVVNPIACATPPATGYVLGSICVNALTGGTAPFTYTLVDLTNGGAAQTHVEPLGANYCFLNIDFGIYELSVTDANGCTIVKSNLIMSNPVDDLVFGFTSVANCALGASLTATISGAIGPGPYQFGILDLTISPWASIFFTEPLGVFSHTFNGLTPGAIYTIVVRDTTTGCVYFETASATSTNSTMGVTPLVANPVPCRGGANGSVTFSLTGINAGTTSISYSVHYASNNLPVGAATNGTLFAPFVSSVTVGPLALGTYNIQFTENGGPISGCGVTSANFTIVESATALNLSATTTNDNCNVNAGRINPTASGGTGPYLYQYLPSPSVAPTATLPGAWTAINPFNGESGTYDVYVRDAYGCIRMVTVVIGLDPTPVITATLLNPCVAQGTYQIRVDMLTAGVAPYTFSIDGGAFVANTTPFTISGLSSGVHTVQVRDRNGCGNTVSVTILTPLIVSAAFTIQPTCFNNNGTITVTASGGSGNYEYTLLTPPATVVQGPQASNTFVGYAATVAGYIVRVRDLTTNCIVNIPFNPTPATLVSFNATTTAVSCNGGSDGTITVTLGVGNNNPVYTYQITAGPVTTPVQTSNIFTGLPAGTYSVEVVSGRDCRLTLSNIIIGTPTTVVATGSATAFGCNPDNTVRVSVITVTGAGGTPAYTYSIDGINYFTTNTFNIIDNGAIQNFTVYVKDLKGCIDTDTVTINPLPTITNVTISALPTITCTNPELVTLTVTGGSGNYTYQVLPAGAANVTQVGVTNQFNISAPGTYNFQVTDTTTLCTFAVVPYVVAPFNNLDVVATATTPVTCFGDSNGAIAINVTGYSGAYTYTIFDSLGNPVLPINRPGNTTVLNPQPIGGLLAGNYTIQVSETATPFCVKVSNVVTVGSPSAALAILVTSTPITCVTGNNDGTISATATGGWTTAPYEFQLQIGAAIITSYSTNPNFTGLTQGTYTVYVRDVRGCILSSANVTLVNPTTITATVNATPSLLACNGDTTTINISGVSGGQGSNYTYTIKGPLPSTIASGPFQLPASGSVSVSGIPVGNYDVEIRDGWNCFNNFPVAITQPPVVGASLVQTTILTCTPNTGSVTLTGSGGTPPYSYSATGVAGSFSGLFNPSILITGLNAGTYHYYIQDANGCMSVVSNDVVITAPDPLLLTLLSTTNTTINCFGDSTGVINVSAQGGLGNYVYTLTNTGTGVITTNTTGIFTGLFAGNYEVDVVSGDCNVAFIPITITQPAIPFDVTAFSISGVTCSGNRDGEIVLRITGYVGPLTYVITTSTAIPPVYNSQTIQLPVTQTPPVTVPVTPFDPLVWYATISNLAPNTVSSPPGVTPITYSDWYSILLQNGPLGCSDELRNLVIERPEPISAGILPSATQHVLCFGEVNGSFTVAGLDLSGNPMANLPIWGGTPAYQITINYVTHYDNSVPPVLIDDSVYTNLNNGVGGLFPNTHVFQNLSAGTYSGAIKDQNGCIQRFTQVINDGPNFKPSYDSECILNVRQYTINVNSTPTGQVATYSLDGTLPYNSVSTYTGLTPGSHYVDVNIAGCIHRVPFTVDAPIVLTVSNGGLNEIVATSTGGSGGNSYTFNGYDNGTNSYIITETGVYTVRVTDSDGCYDEKLFPKTFIPIKIINVYTPGDGGGWSPLNTSNYPNLMTRIYDRYGRMVAELPEGQQWFGKYNGQELPSGDYWYVVKVDQSNSDEFVGHFTLYR